MKESLYQDQFSSGKTNTDFQSRFSKRTFTQSQRLSLRIRPYREFTELLEEMLRIKKALSVPHFTTIQKALLQRYGECC